jgi:FkbM family methyltransferase
MPLYKRIAKIEKINDKNLGEKVLKIYLKKYDHPIYLRNDTSDVPTYREIFEDFEYDIVVDYTPEVIIDAGSNIGLSAIYFAEKFPQCKIIAIEPESGNFNLLLKNIENYHNIHAVQAALWDKNGMIELLDIGTGNSGFMTGMTIEEGERIMSQASYVKSVKSLHYVKSITIEYVMKEYNLKKIDILKIDVEGAEKEIFESCNDWINIPNSVLIEFHERKKKGCKEAFNKYANIFDNHYLRGDMEFFSKNGYIKYDMQRNCT